MTTSDINTQRLDLVSGPGTTAMVATVRQRLQAADRRRIIAIGRSANGHPFRVTAPASDPAVAAWLADGAPTCSSRWDDDYDVEPAENRAEYVGE